MKKIVLLLSVFVLAASCGKDIPTPESQKEPEQPILTPSSDGDDGYLWEFAPIDFKFIVENADGENLLDPTVEGNIVDNDIWVSMGGEAYGIVRQTRVIFPEWRGLRIEPYSSNDDTPVLKFGEFDRFKEYEFSIDWGDGTTTAVVFHDKVEWVEWTPESGYGSPEQHPDTVPVPGNELWIDGERISGEDWAVAKIVK